MSIVEIPGFWDQNKEALTQMAQTLTRIANPYFDSQMALMQNIRENPANQQKIVDMAYMDPDMFAQTFGPRMLQQMSTMGKPSFEAQREVTLREIAGQDPSQVKPTVLTESALNAAGVKNPLEKKIAEASLEGQLQQNRYYSFRQTQEELEAGAKNPGLIARYRTQQQAMAQNPNANLFNPSVMAEEYYNNKNDLNPDFLNRLEAMFTMAPESKNLFETSLSMLNQRDLEKERAQRDDARQDRQDARTDDVLDRQIRADARQLIVDLAEDVDAVDLTFEEAYNYLRGEGSPVIQRILRDRGVAQRAIARGQEFRTISTEFGNLARMTNKGTPEAQAAKQALEARLTNFLGTGVILKKMGEGVLAPGDPRTEVQLANGITIDGKILGEMIADRDYATIVSATDAQLVAMLQALNAQEATLTPAAFNQASSRILAEQQRRQNSRGRTTSARR